MAERRTLRSKWLAVPIAYYRFPPASWASWRRDQPPRWESAYARLSKILIVGSFAAAVAVSAPAFGRVERGGIGGGAFFGETRTLRALDLTADQLHAVHAILRAHSPVLRRLADDEKTARQAIDDKLLGAGEVTEQDLDALVQQDLQLRAALTRERIETALEVWAELTPEQVQQVASIRATVSEVRTHHHPLFEKPIATR